MQCHSSLRCFFSTFLKRVAFCGRTSHFSTARGCHWETRLLYSRIRVSLWRVRVSRVAASARVTLFGVGPLQTVHFLHASNVARCLLGLATIVAVSSQVQAQQYYYPATGTSQPGYYYTQPTTTCASGYCQAAQAPQYYQAAQATQYYQAAQATQ